jgi:hypothetical protein
VAKRGLTKVDLQQVVEGTTAVKTVFDTIRTAITLARDATGLLKGSPSEKEAATKALAELDRQSQIAQAQLAQLLGYELCRCEFPPIPMLQVGNISVGQIGRAQPIYECPKCLQTTAGGWAYDRRVPERKKPGAPAQAESAEGQI